MFSEDQLLPISALQHLQFCRRRCALVHTERLWQENRWTAEGRILHETVHQEDGRRIGKVRVARGLRLVSLQWGLYGVADVVEFTPCNELQVSGATLPGIEGRWLPCPIEYKRGKIKSDKSFTVQLCAQTVCLEEMFGTTITEGMLYFGKSGRRKTIAIDSKLRGDTQRLAEELHQLLQSGETPLAVKTPKCASCSLNELCMPEISRSQSATRYNQKNIDSILHEKSC